MEEGMERNAMRRVLCVLAVAALGVAGIEAQTTTLKFSFWAANDNVYFKEVKPIAAEYKKTHPNVNVELEFYKDSENYENAMKIRNSANDLPDVMFMKPAWLVSFKDIMLPLQDLKVAKENLYAKEYSVEGSVVGLPTSSFNEFVYYNKKIFKELGLSIPTTWDEYLATVKKIKTSKKYIPVAMGAKDSWPVYPFNFYMPFLVSENGDFHTEMGKDPEPFAKGKAFRAAYEKIDQLYKLEPFGKSPLGISFDQSSQMFTSGKAAMIVAGQWYVSGNFKNEQGDIDNLGIFFLPTRNTAKDTFIASVMADGFIGIPKNGKNIAEAKEFLEWFFTVYYEDFINYSRVYPTMKGSSLKDAFWSQAFAAVPKDQIKFIVLNEAGDARYTKITDNIHFDQKKMGQEMLAKIHKNLPAMMDAYAAKWKDAYNKVK